MTTLTATQLAKSYNGRQVVKNVGIEVKAGSIVGLLGQNWWNKSESRFVFFDIS